MATNDTTNTDLTPTQDTFDVSKFFDSGPKGFDAFKAAYDPATGITPELADIAWRTKYGIGAPDSYKRADSYGIKDFTGRSLNDAMQYWNKVQSGDLAKMNSGGKGYDLSTWEGQFLQSSAKEKARQEALNAVRPAAESLAGQYGEVGQAYQQGREFLQGEKDPLESRYANLIDQITGRKTSAINRQTTATSNELGRRGISGGLAEQTLADAVNPLETEFGTLLKDVGFEREKSLRDLMKQITDLTTQETADKRSIRQSVADLIANTSLGGLQTGRQDYTQAAQSRIDQDRFNYQKEQNEIANALAQKAANLQQSIFDKIDLPQSEVAIRKALADLADTGSSGGAGLGATFGSNAPQPTSSAPSFTPQLTQQFGGGGSALNRYNLVSNIISGGNTGRYSFID